MLRAYRRCGVQIMSSMPLLLLLAQKDPIGYADCVPRCSRLLAKMVSHGHSPGVPLEYP
jgi:hypothetical protein